MKSVIAAGIAAIAVAGCGASSPQTKTVTRTATVAKSSAAPAPAPAWQAGTPLPNLTAAQLQQAGVSESTAWIGDADQRLGELANAQGTKAQRIGRCVGEQMGIHDASHEYALLIAYKAQNTDAQQAVGKAVGTCVGLQVTHAASFEQPLSAKP